MKTSIKLITTSVFILAFCFSGNAQFFKKLAKKAEKAAERTVERRVEKETTKKTDQALDSVLGTGNENQKAPTPPQNPSGQENSGSSPTTNQGQSNTPSSGPKTLSVYSKFDFVPGDKLLFFDDFANDFIGDFPSKWNTDGGGEIVTVSSNDSKWLGMISNSYYIPDVPSLPENYTVEFDLIAAGVDGKTSSQAYLHVILDESDKFGYGSNSVYAYLPFCQYIDTDIRIWNNIERKNTINNYINADLRSVMTKTPHISIAVNKQRFRLWVNEKKYIDVPRLVPNGKITTLKFEPVGFKDGKEKLLISNIKVAEGGIDLRRKLISEGRISTNGILFDSNSANIRPESMGIIRQIYQVMQQDASIKLKIVGHTDSDGSDDANMKLSKNRAEAVKKALVDIYNANGDRLSTEGKGESEPVGDNATSDGKAQNRRVEFIKV